MHKFWKILKNSILAAIAIFSLLIIISSAGFFGHKTYVVRSGSMEPKIGIGSLVIDSKTTSYKIGDVITFHRSGFADPVTHRIVSIKTSASGTPVYTVKGDANPVADSETVASSSIIGKVSYSLPYVGYLSLFIKTLPGLILLIIIPATLIIYHELLSVGREVSAARFQKKQRAAAIKRRSATRKKPTPRLAKKTAAKIVMGVFLLAISSTYIHGHTSSAALSDSVATTDNSITTTSP